MTDPKLAKLEAQKAAADAAWLQLAEKDFMLFVRGLFIDGQSGKALFNKVMARFQRVFFEDIAPSIEQLRDGKMPDFRRWWVERTKKGSKDADLAIIVAWLVAFPRRPFYGQIGAGDREQAGIVKKRLAALLHHNPVLNEHIKIVGNEIRSTKMTDAGMPMCTFDIMSADISGAHGGTPDLLVVNELSHITKKEFASNLMANAAGVAQGIAIVATNAGIKGTFAHKWRLNALSSDQWVCHLLSRPAPWHSRATIADEKSRETRSRYLRLWWGIWVSGKGDAVSEEDLSLCFCLSGPDAKALSGWVYFFGLDLGVSHDHAALACMGVHLQRRKVRVCNWTNWDPKDSDDGKVDLTDVRAKVAEWYPIYRPLALLYDPHQAELMVQDLKKKPGIVARAVKFVPEMLSRMATAFIQLVSSHDLECYNDVNGKLMLDFGKFDIVQKSYGHRLEAVADEFGHADLGTAVVVTLPACLSFLNGGSVDATGDVACSDHVELTEEQMEQLPDEFKQLFAMESGEARTAAIGKADETEEWFASLL